MNITAEQLYNDLWAEARPGFEERLGSSLNPRAPEMLEVRFAALGVTSEDTVLDVGCREAGYAVQFAQQFGCRVVALDPMLRHIEWARAKVTEGGVGHRVTVLQGRMEEIPLDNDAVDYIWCRDVLNVVDLPRGLAECFRVLRAGGTMLTYQNFATSLMEPQEAERMYAAMAIRPENMSREYFEQRTCAVGFHVRDVERIESEWRECGIEQGWCSMDPLLLRMCRMRRLEEELVREYGRPYFEAEYGAAQWLVYQALGKLSPMIHILEKPGTSNTMRVA